MALVPTVQVYKGSTSTLLLVGPPMEEDFEIRFVCFLFFSDGRYHNPTLGHWVSRFRHLRLVFRESVGLR